MRSDLIKSTCTLSKRFSLLNPKWREDRQEMVFGGYTWKVLPWPEILWYIKLTVLKQHRILDVSWRVGQELLVETTVVSLEVLMVTTSLPTCISLSFRHCPLRKTIRRWKRLKNQIEPIKGSPANILGASGSVPHICFFHSTIPRNWEHGGRNMAVSLGLGKRLLLLRWSLKVPPGCTWLASVTPVILNPFYKYWGLTNGPTSLLGRNYGKRPKNAQTHGPFLKPHLVATWLSQKGLRHLLILRRSFLLEDFGPGLWGSGLPCPLLPLTINVPLVKRLFLTSVRWMELPGTVGRPWRVNQLLGKPTALIFLQVIT